jgi:glucose/arabinose dehydrogenase
MIRKTLFATGLLTATLLASTACSAQPAAGGKPFKETVVADFDSPWAMTFLPDKRMLVTEKQGQMLLVSADGKTRQTVATITVDSAGQGGLMTSSSPPISRPASASTSAIRPQAKAARASSLRAVACAPMAVVASVSARSR